jgi:hypothetical protein
MAPGRIGCTARHEDESYRRKPPRSILDAALFRFRPCFGSSAGADSSDGGAAVGGLVSAAARKFECVLMVRIMWANKVFGGSLLGR